MPKLIPRIVGGLGNQLFIYATAKALAMRSGATLALDTHTGFCRDRYQRRFTLQCFDIQYEEASLLERFDFPGGRSLRYALREINRYLPVRHRFYCTENTGQKKGFMPELMSIQPAACTWLEGYWQSPHYFEDIRTELLRELTVQSPFSSETLRVAEQIQVTNSVCVHLRLSRNIVNGKEVATGKQLEWQFYMRCMDYMAQHVENPRFFCFSDNPNAVALAQTLPYNISIIAHNKGDERAYEDFYLMSLCRHFILSNSTFGWWPAWLCQYPGSITVSPPLHFWDNKDILPSHWVVADFDRQTP